MSITYKRVIQTLVLPIDVLELRVIEVVAEALYTLHVNDAPASNTIVEEHINSNSANEFTTI